MTKKTKNHSPQHNELLKQHVLERQEVTEVSVFIRKHTKPVITIVALLIVATLAVQLMKTQKLKNAAAADLLLAKASTPEDYEQVINAYGSTKAAIFAKMVLAKEQFNAGQYDAATAIYDDFVAKKSDSDMLPTARLNQIMCKETAGQMDEAAGLYDAFAKKNESSYLAPLARMAQARCLESLNKWGEAKTIYEDLLVNENASAWNPQIQEKLTIIEGKLRSNA